MICNLEKITHQKQSGLLADDNDVRDVIIVCRDHISCIFDGLSNTNVLGIPADSTADKKFERVLFSCTEAIY